MITPSQVIALLEKLRPLTAYGLVGSSDTVQAGLQQDLQAAIEAVRSLEQEPVDMTEQEFMDKCLSDMMGGWVPIDTYLRMYPEDTKSRIQSRVKQGGWKRRVHYAAPKGGSPWVNLPKVREWVESEGEETPPEA